MRCNRIRNWYASIFALITILASGHVHWVNGQFQALIDAKVIPLQSSLASKHNENAFKILEAAKRTLENSVSEKILPVTENIIEDVSRIMGDVSNTSESTTESASESVQFAAANSTVEVNDCLGLGKTIAKQLESLLKNDENGTKAQDVRFYMSSRKHPHRVEVIIGKQFGLEWTDFEVRRNTVVIIHGFLSDGNTTWMNNMTSAFLKMEDVNVIAVDWSAGGNTYNYYKAVVNTRTTGNQIATLFGQIANYTLEKNGLKKELWGSIHCVGHSLGAHICGYAANEIKRRGSDWMIRRITGLDPAQPCFKTGDLALKLDKNDAPFVDIIHTNGRFLTKLGLGLPHPIGHADFFPNGGKLQPGCDITNFIIPILSIPREVINGAVCSHGRSYHYFTESINIAAENSCTFWAHPWDRTYRNIEQALTINCHEKTCTEMGINSEKYAYRGTFFVLTSASQPYCHVGEWDREEVKKILQDDYKETLED